MQTRTVKFGDKSFTLVELPLRANAEWRRQFEATLDPILSMMSGMNSIEINTAADLGKIVEQLRGVLLRSPDVVADLIISYSPALQAEREWIETNVYESELLAAVGEVLALAYPFGQILRAVGKLTGATNPPSR